MDSKKILEKLFAIATNQQKMIEKLAQTTPMSMPTPATHNPREAGTILNALPPDVRSVIDRLEVHGNVVKVRFQAGKGSDLAFQTVQNVVTKLQQENKLMGKNYTISEA